MRARPQTCLEPVALPGRHNLIGVLGTCGRLFCDSTQENSSGQKMLLGVGQAQVRHEDFVENVPALAVAASAMMLTSATFAYDPTGKLDSLPSSKWRRKKSLHASTQSLLQHLRHEVWAEAIRFSGFVSPHAAESKLQKLQTALESALFWAVR